MTPDRPTATYMLRLPPDLLARAKDAAAAADRPLASWLRRVIADALERGTA